MQNERRTANRRLFSASAKSLSATDSFERFSATEVMEDEVDNAASLLTGDS